MSFKYKNIVVENLRKLEIKTSILDSTDENMLSYYKKDLIYRGNSNIEVSVSIQNLNDIINKRNEKNPIYSITEFSDINLKTLDPSVRYGLKSVGEKLVKLHSLTLYEMTYYFVLERYNFLKSISIGSDTYQLQSSQYFKIISNIESCMSFVTFDESLNSLIVKPKNNAEVIVWQNLNTTAMRYCYRYFNLVIVPIPSQSGKDKTLIFINDIRRSDSELFLQYYYLYRIKLFDKERNLQSIALDKAGKKRKLEVNEIKDSNSLSPSNFQFIKDAIPTQFKFITEYLLAVCTNDEDILLSYGISPIRKQNLILRMAESIKNGTTIKDREMGNAEITGKNKRLLRIHCDKNKIFFNKNLQKNKSNSSLKNSDPILYEKLLGVMQQVARTLHGNSKSRGDTPVDAILLVPEDFRSELSNFTGGVVSRMASTLNEWLKQNNYNLHLSDMTVYKMFADAKIEFKKSKKDYTEPRLNQHFCAATLKYMMLLSQMFSNEISYFSADAKSLIRVAAGTHVKEAVIQLVSDQKRLLCHDAGVDTLGKICLYVIELISQDPELYDFFNSSPENNNDINKLGYIKITESMIPGWNKDVHTKVTEGLGVAFAHHHNVNPETGARNASDISDLIYLNMPYFESKDGNLKSTIFLQVDNSKGASDSQTRFVLVLLFLKFDLDTLVVASNAGRNSKFNPVEQLNGFLSNRLNGYAIDFLNSEFFQFLSQEEFKENMDMAIQRVIDITDGTTCNRTGGCIDVRKAANPPNYEGFKFLPKEIAEYLASKDKENFKSQNMMDFGDGDEVTAFYNAAWRILHSTNGLEKCVHITKHTMTIMKNQNNPDIQSPIRGSEQLFDLFKSFGGTIPLPIPSERPDKQNMDGNFNSPGYMDLEEILLLNADKRLQSVQKYHLPELLMAKYIIDNPNFLTAYIANNKQIDNNIMEQLQKIMRASKKDLHIDFNYRNAKLTMQKRELDLKLSQTNRGVSDEVFMYFNTLPEYNNKRITVDILKEFLKNNNQKNIKGNKPILIELVYNLLLEKKIIQQMPPMNILQQGAIALNNAELAMEEYEEQNNNSDNDD